MPFHCRLRIANLDPNGRMLWNIAILACSSALAVASVCDSKLAELLLALRILHAIILLHLPEQARCMATVSSEGECGGK